MNVGLGSEIGCVVVRLRRHVQLGEQLKCADVAGAFADKSLLTVLRHASVLGS